MTETSITCTWLDGGLYANLPCWGPVARQPGGLQACQAHHLWGLGSERVNATYIPPHVYLYEGKPLSLAALKRAGSDAWGFFPPHWRHKRNGMAVFVGKIGRNESDLLPVVHYSERTAHPTKAPLPEVAFYGPEKYKVTFTRTLEEFLKAYAPAEAHRGD